MFYWSCASKLSKEIFKNKIYCCIYCLPVTCFMLPLEKILIAIFYSDKWYFACKIFDSAVPTVCLVDLA